MRNNSAGGIEFQVSRRSVPVEAALSPGIDARQFLHFLLLIPAGVLALMPLGIYPPLDTRLPKGLIICFFLISAVIQLTNIIQRRPSSGLGLGRVVAVCSGLALPLLGILLFLNGKLDKIPGNEVKETVVRKTSFVGYRQTQYTLVVTSWQPGRSYENLNVGSRVYERAAVGKTIVMEIHKGYFGLPWHGKISPE
jgi:hypothetical protein